MINKDYSSVDLQSSTKEIGELVTQIVHFRNGNKRTIQNIRTQTIKQGEFTKFMLSDGRMVMINTANVDMIEVFSQKI